MAAKQSAAKPMCAQCERPVDSMESEEDGEHDELVFTVRCHGQREVTKLKGEVLRRLKGIEAGEAFRPRGTLLGG